MTGTIIKTAPRTYQCKHDGCRFRFQSKNDWPIENIHVECPTHGPGAEELERQRLFGPGTVLADMLKRLGFKESSSCQCRQRQSQMNAWGPDGCRENLETIIGWLVEQAPSLTPKRLIRRLVLRAIRKSEKLLAKHT